METLDGVWRRDGVFLRRDALTFGIDDATLRRGIRSGELVRVRHGAYTYADHWRAASAEDRHLIKARAVMRSAECECVLSHTTAALTLGMDVWDLDLGAVHITRQDHKGGRREAGVVQHRGLLRPGDVVAGDGWPTTSAARTALDVTTITDVQHALVVVASAVHKGLVTKEDLEERAQAMAHVPGSLTTDLVLRLADGRLDGPGETRAYYGFWLEGLPAPELQWEVRNESGGLVALLDFAWPGLGIWVEFDGRSKYQRLLRPGETASDAVVKEKIREDEVRRLTGWICIRIVWADLERPDRIVAKIRRAIASQAVA